MSGRGARLTAGNGTFAQNPEAAADARIRRALAGKYYHTPEEAQWLAEWLVKLQREIEVLRGRLQSRRRSEHTAKRPEPAP